MQSLHEPKRDALADLVSLMLENKSTQIALIAHKASLSYTPILAGTLADQVRHAFDALEKEGLCDSSRQRQKLSKQQAYTGKLYDPVDVTTELVHHVQWSHRRYASYFTRKTDGGTGGTKLSRSSSGASGAPMSATHLLAQIALAERVNDDSPVEFLLKCSSSNHLVPIYRTSPGMRAHTEVYVPRQDDGRARRLDVAICNGEQIVFNVEILHSSRTAEGRRDGSWAEANAIHVLEEVQRREGRIRIVCEPRADQYVHCHFLGRAVHRWSCRRCVERTARARIVAAIARVTRARALARRLRELVDCEQVGGRSRSNAAARAVAALEVSPSQAPRGGSGAAEANAVPEATPLAAQFAGALAEQFGSVDTAAAAVAADRLCLMLAPLVRMHVRRRRLASGVVFMWQQRVRERKARVETLAAAFCHRLRCAVHLRRSNATRHREREAAKREQAERITGVRSKAKLRRGLSERDLQRQQHTARGFFERKPS